MLVLSRRVGEAVRIGNVVVRVTQVGDQKTRLGIEAPDEVPIYREELLEIPEIRSLFGLPCAALPQASASPAA